MRTAGIIAPLLAAVLAWTGPVAAGLVERWPLAAQSRTWTVTHLGDSGAGSLRWAIDAAAKGRTPDMIRFAPGLRGTVVLQAPLQVRDAIAVLGPGAPALTLDASAAGSAFRVDGVAPVLIDALRIVGATDSAIVAQRADLRIERCLIEQNFGLRGAAVRMRDGVLRIADSELARNIVDLERDPEDGVGGAVSLQDSTAEILRSRISANQATRLGGGVHAAMAQGGGLLIRDSLVDANIAPTQGGGLYLLDGRTSIVNSTVSGNRSERNATLWFNAELEIGNSTLAHNRSVQVDTPGQCPGLCVSSSARLTLVSSIVSDNRDVFDNPIDLVSASEASLRLQHALVKTLEPELRYTDLGGNRLGVDPLLRPLQQEAGAQWPAHVPEAASPAIDAGLNPWGLASDQRGGCHRRDHGAGVDIGAAEAQPATADCLSGKRGRRRD